MNALNERMNGKLDAEHGARLLGYNTEQTQHSQGLMALTS